MDLQATPYRRNLFEIENARNLNKKELVDTFVPTQSFWRLLSAKHHVVLGSRGSGKTALAKMLSHDHLSLLDDARAKSAISEQQFIGIYVPTRLEWVGGLKNKPWQSDMQKEEFFQWRLNLSSCLALVDTLESCVTTYCENDGQRTRTERELALALSSAWADDSNHQTLDSVRCHLEDLEFDKHVVIAKCRAAGEERPSGKGPGAAFDTELFTPLRRGIRLASRILKLRPECTWLLCLDEAEFLEELHHRIINSHMRTHSGNLFFKITTMPYCHYTLATNSEVSLDVGHDFEYVYIDSDPVLYAKTSGETNSIGTMFARAIFSRRVEASGLNMLANLGIGDVLGGSDLLDDKTRKWKPNSPEMKLLRKHASTETVDRAKRLAGTPAFSSEIARKIHGALLLREAFVQTAGRSETDIYSGSTVAMRCGDANPRRLIRIFNALLLSQWGAMRGGSRHLPIDPKEQSRVLRGLSTSTLVRVQSEPKCGKRLFELLQIIGNYMHRSFHETPLTTDQITSIRIDPDIDNSVWELVQRAVELGLLYPNTGPNQRDEMPNRDGTFHLSFILAPHFFLLPRRGRARQLSTILQNASLNDPGQLKLF